MIRILRQIFHTGIVTEPLPPITDPDIEKIGAQLEEEIRRRFKGSLAIRQVDAGSCNACELEIHAINNPLYNCERFGIHFTASPRFANAAGHRAGLAQYGGRPQEDLQCNTQKLVVAGGLRIRRHIRQATSWAESIKSFRGCPHTQVPHGADRSLQGIWTIGRVTGLWIIGHQLFICDHKGRKR
jgi:hypothetical protein